MGRKMLLLTTEFTKTETFTLTRQRCMELVNATCPDKKGVNLELSDMTDDICETIVGYYRDTLFDEGYQSLEVAMHYDRDIDYLWGQESVMEDMFSIEDASLKLLYFLMNYGKDGFLEYKRLKHNDS